MATFLVRTEKETADRMDSAILFSQGNGSHFIRRNFSRNASGCMHSSRTFLFTTSGL